MMHTRIILKLTFLLTISVNAQKVDKCISYQEEWFQKGIKALKANDEGKAFVSFYASFKMKEKTDLGKIALKKVDSIAEIFRKKKLNVIKGKWKYIYSEPSGSHGKYKCDKIKITNKKIKMYNLKDKSLDKKTSIVFSKVNGLTPIYFDLVMKNKDLLNLYLLNSSLDTLIVNYRGNQKNNTKPKLKRKDFYIRLK